MLGELIKAKKEHLFVQFRRMDVNETERLVVLFLLFSHEKVSFGTLPSKL